MTQMVLFQGGPWHMERRRLISPPPADLPSKAGGEYRLQRTHLGLVYRWYPREEVNEG